MNTPDEQLRAIIDTIPALVWSARPDGSAEFFNRRWLDYSGLSYDEARDWGWEKIVHPEDRNRIVEYWRSILATGELGEIEARLRRFDGEYRWFLLRANPLRNESGAIVKWYGTNVDIEDRKRAEESSLSSELSFRRIVETIPALVWCASPEGELTYVNQRILDYTGASLGDLAQAGWYCSSTYGHKFQARVWGGTRDTKIRSQLAYPNATRKRRHCEFCGHSYRSEPGNRSIHRNSIGP